MLFPDVTYLSVEVDESGLSVPLTSGELTAWIFGTRKEGSWGPELEAERRYKEDPLPKEFGDMGEVFDWEYDEYSRYIPKYEYQEGQYLFPLPDMWTSDKEWEILAERAKRLPRGALKSFKLIITGTQVLGTKDLL